MYKRHRIDGATSVRFDVLVIALLISEAATASAFWGSLVKLFINLPSSEDLI